MTGYVKFPRLIYAGRALLDGDFSPAELRDIANWMEESGGHAETKEPRESWWRDTPWPEIREYALAWLSAQQLAEWLKRDDVIERSKREP